MATPATQRLDRPDTPPSLRAVPDDTDFAMRVREMGVDVERPLSTGALTVDLTTYQVLLGGRDLELSPRQVELLALFLGAPNRVWSRDQLHWVCWGDSFAMQGAKSRRVDVQLCRIRTKTGLDLFRNVRDRGWALRSP